MVGIVPDMFHAPISAPTASRMEIALATDASAADPDSTISFQEWPFFKMMIIAHMELRISATCMGPSTARAPYRTTDPEISRMRTTSGIIQSAYDGSFTLGEAMDSGEAVGSFGM